MVTMYRDPFDALFDLQRALDARQRSGWLRGATTSRGPFPPINVFQKGDDLVAVVELAGVNKDDLEIQVKENLIRIAGKKAIAYDPTASVHRRERAAGEFDRTLTLPIAVDPDGVKAEYREGVLAIFIPRADADKPRSIKIN
jgi:HSP20 family protein